MMTPFQLLLALGMLITGSINTLSTKAADQELAPATYDGVTYQTYFNHPFVQAFIMFSGEFLCLIAFYLLVFRATRTGKPMDRAKPFNPIIFLLPAICDMTATSTMYVGLALTDASIFQMLRGSVIIFTSALSVIFLKRKLQAYHWIGIALVIGGTALVGTQSKICPEASGGSCPAAESSTGPNMATIGNILIIVAQLIVAIQMVVEEKFISGYDVPALQVVGLEGLWGMGVLSLVLIGMYHLRMPSFLVPPCLEVQQGPNVVNGTSAGADPGMTFINTPAAYGNHFENTLEAFSMMKSNPAIIAALVGNMLSISLFNFTGVSVTKYMNASTRMVLDSLRTIVIWAVSLGLKWESFCWVQLIGFAVLILGTLIYNAMLRVPRLTYPAPPGQAAAAVVDAEDAKTALLVADASGSLNGDGSYGKHDHAPAVAEITVGDLTATPSMRKALFVKKR